MLKLMGQVPCFQSPRVVLLALAIAMLDEVFFKEFLCYNTSLW
jgi:hypothetical protein